MTAGTVARGRARMRPCSGSSPDFVEALARGLAIITAFSPTATALSVSDAAARTSLPGRRPGAC